LQKEDYDHDANKVAKMFDVVVLMANLNNEGHWDGESIAMQVKDHRCKLTSKLGA
jgi:hypothetical protein